MTQKKSGMIYRNDKQSKPFSNTFIHKGTKDCWNTSTYNVLHKSDNRSKHECINHMEQYIEFYYLNQINDWCFWAQPQNESEYLL